MVFFMQILRAFLTFFCCKKPARKRKRSESEDEVFANEAKVLKLDASTETNEAKVLKLDASTETGVPEVLSDKTQTECFPTKCLSIDTQTDQESELHVETPEFEEFLDFPFLTDIESI